MHATRTFVSSLLIVAAIATGFVFLIAVVADDIGETGCGGG